MAHTSTAGRLLIATPAIGDGTFEQSVIYMLHHDPVGALGVIINDPTELSIDELLPRWADLASSPATVFGGGPVEPNGFIGVGRAVDTGIATTIDLDGDPAITAAEVDQLRIFRGYAGWGPHQLDAEYSGGGWFVVDAKPDDLWTSDPDELYEDVLLRQRGAMRWFANAPTDPSQN